MNNHLLGGTVSAVGTCLAPQQWVADWFDTRQILGRGYRNLPDATAYLLGALRQIATMPTEPDSGGDWGISVASEHGCVRLHDEIDAAVLLDQGHLISPTAAPHFAHNLPASRAAIEYGITGMCLSFHSSVTAATDSLANALAAIRDGRSSHVIVGATEAPRQRGREGALAMVVSEAADGARQGTSELTLTHHSPGDLHTVLQNAYEIGPVTLVGSENSLAPLCTTPGVQSVVSRGAIDSLMPIVSATQEAESRTVVTVTDTVAIAVSVTPKNATKTEETR